MTRFKLNFSSPPYIIQNILCFIYIFLPFSFFAQEEVSYHPLGESRLVTSSFGYRADPVSRSRDRDLHKGIDLAAQVGDSVYAWRSGNVAFTGNNNLSGNMVNLQHSGGYISKYHHLYQILVEEGDVVEAGQLIGRAGRSGQVSGPHLHFSILKDGKHLDPYPFLKAAGDVPKDLVVQPSQSGPPAKKAVFQKEMLIYSVPGKCDIYIDEEYYGKTPVTVKLGHGEHFIEIDAGEGYEYFIGRIWVSAESEYLYTARLQRRGSETMMEPPVSIQIPSDTLIEEK